MVDYPRCYDTQRQLAYLLTRRCAGRLFRLKPDKFTKQLFVFILAFAAAKHDVEINALMIMSNHYHLVVSPMCKDSDISGFMQCLNYNTAIVLNDHQNTTGTFWEPNNVSIEALETEEAVIRAIVYVMCNPVEAGLVRDPADWPGLSVKAKDCTSAVFPAKRPKFFGTRSKKPESLKLRCIKPRAFNHLTNLQYRDLIIKAVAKRLEEIWEARHSVGLRYLGAAAVRRQHIDQSPSSPEVPKAKRVADDELPAYLFTSYEQIQREKAFREAHRECMDEVKAGKRPIFPFGTYKMVRTYGFPVAANE